MTITTRFNRISTAIEKIDGNMIHYIVIVMYTVDPVTDVFGKDVASLVYRHLFRINMQNVNKQYKQFLLGVDREGSVRFRGQPGDSRDRWFNYRLYCPDSFGIIFSSRYTPIGWKSYVGPFCWRKIT